MQVERQSVIEHSRRVSLMVAVANGCVIRKEPTFFSFSQAMAVYSTHDGIQNNWPHGGASKTSTEYHDEKLQTNICGILGVRTVITKEINLGSIPNTLSRYETKT
jgi:hypothetical protein